MKGLIIVPYRDRADHLRVFRRHYTNMDILVVEQSNRKAFNRGKLFNVGVLESPEYDYYVLHDVDMISDRGHDYSFPNMPTHCATNCSQFNYTMPYKEYFGGVTIISREHYMLVNGFHNDMYGWGAEDDMLRQRVLDAGLTIDTRKTYYTSLPHRRIVNEQKRQRNVEILLSNDTAGIKECQYQIQTKIDGHLIVHL